MRTEINVTNDLLAKLALKMHYGLNDWQSRWSHQQFHRNRLLHKSRQIGADWYFTLEAINDACLTGRNKIFIGGEWIINDIDFMLHHIDYQSHGYEYHKQFEDIGKLIFILSNGAKIIFISNTDMLAGLCGDVYAPEWSWNEQPLKIVLTALDLSRNEKWRRTFYSSRSKTDNASQLGLDDMIFKNNKIEDEITYFDRVNHFRK